MSDTRIRLVERVKDNSLQRLVNKYSYTAVYVSLIVLVFFALVVIPV